MERVLWNRKLYLAYNCKHCACRDRASTPDVAVAGLGWVGIAAAGGVDLRCNCK